MDDIETTFRWLDNGQPPLRYSFQLLIKQVHAEADSGNFPAALSTLEDLRYTARALGDELEQARIQIENARVSMKVQNIEKAVTDLKKALRSLTRRAVFDTQYRHHKAVAYWLLGYLYWPIPSVRKEAIVAWESALDSFQELTRLYKHLVPDGDWYKDRADGMRKAFEEAIEMTARHNSVLPWRYLPKMEIHAPYTGSIQVLDRIPSGRSTLTTAGYIPLSPKADEFSIAGKKYSLYNLRGANRSLALQPTSTYYVARVNEESMDLVGIEPGDYVLLRDQDTADVCDIIAAQMPDGQPQGGLKYFSRQKDKLILTPQSSNPDLHPIEITNGKSDGFRVHSVSMGVFKPVY